MQTRPRRVEFQPPSEDGLKRIGLLLRKTGGKQVIWGSINYLDVWIAEQRETLNQEASKRVQRSSWALVIATAGLMLSTVGLIVATLCG